MFAFTSLPGFYLILLVLEVSSFTCNEWPRIFIFSFVICCPFLSERRFSGVLHCIREILFLPDTNLIKSIFFFFFLLQNPTYATESEDSAPQSDPENDEKICQTADLHWISPSQTIPSSSSADPDSSGLPKYLCRFPQYFRSFLEMSK